MTGTRIGVVLARHAWLAALAIGIGIGLAATVRHPSPDRSVASAIVIGVLVTLVGLAQPDVTRHLKHPVLSGAAVTTVGALALPGLRVVLDGWTVPVLLGLALTSPWAMDALMTWWSVRGRRDRSRPPLSPRERLRWEWDGSTRELARSRDTQDVLLLVEARAAILDEILACHDGRVPPYVWPAEESSSRFPDPG